MSKTKLALLVFCVTFLINGLAFLFSHKALTVEETKNVWLYELPLSPSPLDSYVAVDIGPHSGVIGTLFSPHHDGDEKGLTSLLADSWKWDDGSHTLMVKLKDKLVFSNGDPITAQDFVKTHEYIAPKIQIFSEDSALGILARSTYKENAGALQITLPAKSANLEHFMKEALTSPLSGVLHSSDFALIEGGKNPKSKFISSGPYFIEKWEAKEISLISRADFPGGMQKGFIRTLKFQSAPVKNPSCDFLAGRKDEEKTIVDHQAFDTQSTVSILWACRSYQEPGTFCADVENRKILAGLLAGTTTPSGSLLSGKKIKFRIPFGSDSFRQTIRTELESLVKRSGGETEEISYFFKSEKDSDFELLFAMTPREMGVSDVMKAVSLSTRLGQVAANSPNVLGLVESYPLKILMKNMRGEAFSKVFIEPDLDEKKLPL